MLTVLFSTFSESGMKQEDNIFAVPDTSTIQNIYELQFNLIIRLLHHNSTVFNITRSCHGSQNYYFAILGLWLITGFHLYNTVCFNGPQR